MLVYFLRHAEAEDAADADFIRRLTAKGLEQAERAGRFCRAAGLLPDVILTSPVTRARQTAEIVGKALAVNVDTAEWLACGMSPNDCAREVAALGTRRILMLVGHEPDFSETIAWLLGIPNPESLRIRKASLTCVDAGPFLAGAGQLQFLVPARLMS